MPRPPARAGGRFPRTGRDMRRRATIGRAIGYGVLLGLAAAAAVEAYAVFLGRNWHAVLPGFAYRSAQLSPDQLRAAARRVGVRTVVNLRGTSPDFDWYLDESRATRDADVAQE